MMQQTDEQVWALQRSEELRAERGDAVKAAEAAVARLRAATEAMLSTAQSAQHLARALGAVK